MVQDANLPKRSGYEAGDDAPVRGHQRWAWQAPTPHLTSSRRGETRARAGNVTSDQFKLAGSADRLAAASGR